MKSTFGFLFCIITATNAMAQSFSLSTAPQISFLNSDKEWEYRPGKSTHVFSAAPTATLYLLLQVGAWKPWTQTKHEVKAEIKKVGAKDQFVWEQLMTLNGQAYDAKDRFAVNIADPGEYIATVHDVDDENKVWATTKFTVAAGTNDLQGGGNLVFCDQVDDDWKAVQPVTKIKSGDCVNLFLTMVKKNIPDISHLAWEVYKVKEDGTDGDYVDELIQRVQGVNIKYIATEEKVCLFNEKGRYRVYAQSWIGTSNHIGNLTDYYAKADLIVE